MLDSWKPYEMLPADTSKRQRDEPDQQHHPAHRLARESARPHEQERDDRDAGEERDDQLDGQHAR